MSTIEQDVLQIFSSIAEIYEEQEEECRNIREIICEQFRNVEKNRIPLIFLTEGVFNSLMYVEQNYCDPYIEVITEDIGEYVCIKHIIESDDYIIYVIKKENDSLYTLRGFFKYHYFSFAPKDIDIQKLKDFVYESCVPFYSANIKFMYPLLIK